MKKLICSAIIISSIVSSLSITGCPAVLTALPEVIGAITSAAQIVDSIETFVNTYFISHPNLEEQKKVSAAIIKCRMALNEALLIARAAKDLNDKNVDKAFEDFKQAYLELLEITRVYGVKVANPNGKMQASPESLTVPDAESASRYARGTK